MAQEIYIIDNDNELNLYLRQGMPVDIRIPLEMATAEEKQDG